MLTSAKLDLLRVAVADEALPLNGRRDAAEHLVRLLIEEVPAPDTGHEEVLKLTRPLEPRWMAESAASATNGESLTGKPLAKAVQSVHRRRKAAVLRLTSEDDSEHPLIRDAAAKLAAPANRASWY